MKKAQNISGQSFGKLTVIERVGSKSHNTTWKCQCECGNLVVVSRGNLLNGHTQSCGCNKHQQAVNRTHGQSRTRLYYVWRNMLNRCYNSKVSDYPNYGGRGISVCKEWKDDFGTFSEWAFSSGYNPKAKRGECTLERKDPNRNYDPGNCRWATETEQANNKRSNQYIEYKGERLTLTQAAKATGVPYKTLHKRICVLHWDVDRALSTPIRAEKAGD